MAGSQEKMVSEADKGREKDSKRERREREGRK